MPAGIQLIDSSVYFLVDYTCMFSLIKNNKITIDEIGQQIIFFNTCVYSYSRLSKSIIKIEKEKSNKN